MIERNVGAVAAGHLAAMPAHSPSTEGPIGVVDDDPAVLASLAFMLKAMGHAVLAYGDPAAALADPRLATARCIILDWKMPEMNGLALLRLLRDRGVTSPAILVASVPSKQCRLEAAGLGAPVVEKPLTGNAIANWIGWLSFQGRALDEEPDKR